MIHSDDTITAIATPPGYGGVGIVRISGKLAPQILQAITGKVTKPRHAEYLSFKDNDNNIIDMGLALYFPGPNSFTGEDVVELQGHGGPVVLELLVKKVLSLGARLAKPGEFSERAFLNDKIDLAQAEAIADLINSASELAARSAMRSLQGVFSDSINTLVEKVLHLRMYVEAAIDFPEEEIDFLGDGIVAAKLDDIEQTLKQIVDEAKQGALLQEGINIVIAGKPNAGKSSLLNLLSGKDSAIVTDIPGTTRDVLKEYISIEGVPAHIYDTAGLRDSNDIVEQEGVKRAKKQIELADMVLFVFDGCETDIRTANDILNYYQQNILKQNQHVIVVCNKIDKTKESIQVLRQDKHSLVKLSAKTGAGLDLLRKQILHTVGIDKEVTGSFIARQRHLTALNNAYQTLLDAKEQFFATAAGELLAEDLRQVQDYLGEITGLVTSDDLLGKIFSSFCIGK